MLEAQSGHTAEEYLPRVPEGLALGILGRDRRLLQTIQGSGRENELVDLVVRTVKDVEQTLQQHEMTQGAVRQIGAVKKHFLEGKTYSEIAHEEMPAISPTRVKQLVTEGISRLRTGLLGRFYGKDEVATESWQQLRQFILQIEPASPTATLIKEYQANKEERESRARRSAALYSSYEGITLPMAIRRTLVREGISFEKLQSMSDEEVLGIRQIGEGSAREIRRALRSMIPPDTASFEK